MRFFKNLSIAIVLLTATAFPQDFRTVHDGLEYAEVSKEVSGKTVKMNLLRLDLAKVRLDVIHAMDAAIGVETTSSIATRHNALAAVNAGFFRLDNSLYAGDAAGLLMIDGVLLSENTNDRVALFTYEYAGRTVARINHKNLDYSLKIGKVERKFSGVNRERKANELILFTPEFHRTTLTSGDGAEVVVIRGKVAEIRNGQGSTRIPANGHVISMNGKLKDEILPLVKPGKKLEIVPPSLFSGMTIAPDRHDILLSASDIVGGIPQLIKKGKIDITWEQEKTSKAFVEIRHPRTAVAILDSGKFLIITIDGRSEVSGGIGLQDLAEYLLSLGAVDAMNLDGGGSTTMWLDGKVMNKPSDKEGERKVSDALIIRKR